MLPGLPGVPVAPLKPISPFGINSKMTLFSEMVKHHIKLLFDEFFLPDHLHFPQPLASHLNHLGPKLKIMKQKPYSPHFSTSC